MENTMQHYDNLRVTPRDALREIGFGNLKGKSDINPQWRIEAITKEFGPCGVGGSREERLETPYKSKAFCVW